VPALLRRRRRPAGCVLVAGGNGCCVLPRRCGGVPCPCARCHRWPRSWWLGELWLWVTLGRRAPAAGAVAGPGAGGGAGGDGHGFRGGAAAGGSVLRRPARRLLHQARVAGLAAPVVV